MTLDQAKVHIMEVAARALPLGAGATIHDPAGKATVISWCWPVGDDADGPNKFATPVRLKVSAWVTRLIMAGDEEFVRRADGALREVMTRRLRYHPHGTAVRPFDIEMGLEDLAEAQ